MKEILLTSSALILALALRQLCRTVSRRMQYALWLLVLVRLLVPVKSAHWRTMCSAAEPVQAVVESGWKRPSCTFAGRHGAAPRTAFLPGKGVAG